MADNVTALTITANATLGWKPLIATPSAVPEAGGCSVFVMIIKNIESPTAMEYIMTFMDGGCGISVLTDPHRRPIICPPITFLGLAVTLLGIATVGVASIIAPHGKITQPETYKSPAETSAEKSILAISSALVVGLACIAAGWGIASAGAAAISAATEKPETFFRNFIIVALAEALAIYGIDNGIAIMVEDIN